jgi:hypothetical protein
VFFVSEVVEGVVEVVVDVVVAVVFVVVLGVSTTVLSSLTVSSFLVTLSLAGVVFVDPDVF